jgi:parallel beta-helix repeat protein
MISKIYRPILSTTKAQCLLPLVLGLSAMGVQAGDSTVDTRAELVAAVRQADPGDIITVLSTRANDPSTPAVYNLVAPLEITRSGTSDQRITIVGKGLPLIQNQIQVSGDYITLKGLKIKFKKGTRQESIGIVVTGSRNRILGNTIGDRVSGLFAEGISVEGGGTRNEIRGNTITKARIAGIHVETNYNTIEKNDISRTLRCPEGAFKFNDADADGIRLFGTGNVFRWNYIHDIKLKDPEGNNGELNCKGYDNDEDPHIDCLQSFNVNVEETTIEQNVCVNNYTSNREMQGIIVSPFKDPEHDYSSKNLKIRNNIIMAYSGIKLACGDKNTDPPDDTVCHDSAQIFNNTIIGNSAWKTGDSAYGVELQYSQGGKVMNNLFYNHSYRFPYFGTKYKGHAANYRNVANYNGVYVHTGKPNRSYLGTNDVVLSWNVPAAAEDPGLKNPNGKDYHLEADSPFTNVGTAVANPHDFDCQDRPRGAAYDMGADEYYSGTYTRNTMVPPTNPENECK